MFRKALLIVSLLSIVLSFRYLHAGPTYFMDEPTYNTEECGPSTALETRGPLLLAELVKDGWSGAYWTGANAWPQDFMDVYWPVDGGLDHVWADNFDLAIYHGHGQTGRIGFSHMHDGRCVSWLIHHDPFTWPDPYYWSCDQSLGLKDGVLPGKASTAIYNSCCTLNMHYLLQHFDQRQWVTMGVGQMLGQHGLQDRWNVHDDMLYFYNYTKTLNNVQSWHLEFHSNPGWYDGYNSTIAWSFGQSQFMVNYRHQYASLGQKISIMNQGGPKWYVKISLYDHGCCGCDWEHQGGPCGPC